MRDRIIQAIIADRTRVQTLLISLALASAGGIATRLLGFELTAEHNTTITLIVTLLFGWIIEAYAAEQNAKGAKKIQENLQRLDPSIQVDRFIGDRTVAAAQDAVTTAVLAGGVTNDPTPPGQP